MTEPRSRREFMGLTAAGAAGALARPWLGDAHALSTAFAPSVDPDLVVFNAKVYTMDPAVPQADGFAVSGGRFVAVGKSADIRALAGKRTQALDAMRAAEDMVQFIESIGAAFKRIFGVFSLKSGVRA